MRIQRKNSRPFYYSLLEGMNPITIEDEWGNISETGEHETVYSDPIKMIANISPAKGEMSIRQFGEALNYDKVLVLAGKSPLEESSILWIDNLQNGEISKIDGENVPHDYIVKRIAESMNFTSIAVEKVMVSRG